MNNDGLVFVGNQWIPARCDGPVDGVYTAVIKYSKPAVELDLVSLTLRLPADRVKLNQHPVITKKRQAATTKSETVVAEKEREEEVQMKAQLPVEVAEDAEGEGVYRLNAVVEPQYESFTFDAESREFHGLLTLSAPKVPGHKQRPGVDVVAVLDVSGSMNGDKISLLRKAMRRLVQNMGNRDRVAFVAFDSNVRTLMPFRTMDEAGQEQAYKLIKLLQAGSCTNLSGGLLTGMELMKKSHENEVTTVLLFTDGQANEGIQNSQDLIQAALRVVGKANPKEWDVNEVSAWLTRLGLEMYTHAFVQNGVDGSMLIHDISDKVLHDELGVKSMHLNKFNRELQKIRGSTAQGAEGEADHFFMQVNTFGFGSDHNAALLKGIANQFDGMYYYMKDDMAIVEGFANCLGGMLSTVAQDIEASLTPAPGVADLIVCKTDNVLKKKNGETVVTFADLQAEEKRHLLVHGTLPALDGPDCAFPLFHCSVEYRNLVEDKDCRTSATCVVNRSGVQGATVENVDVSRNRIAATKAMSEAERLGNLGDLEGARKVINTCMEDISASHSTENEFCKNIQKDLKECLNGLKSQQAFRNVGQRYMAQNVVCHTNERAANFDDMFSGQMAYNNASREATVCNFRQKHRQDSCGGVAALFGDFDDDFLDIKPLGTLACPPPARRQFSGNGVASVASLFGDDDDDDVIFAPSSPKAPASPSSRIAAKIQRDPVGEPAIVGDNNQSPCDDSGDLQTQESVPTLAGFE